jgi:hypothetical protein
MFGKARNANGSWSIFQLKIAIRWLTYGWSRCRNGTIPQYLSGILLFPCFLWSCHNHVRIVVSYPYHMRYIYILYPHATSLDSLSPVCLAGRKTGLILLIFTGNQRFPVNVPVQS